MLARLLRFGVGDSLRRGVQFFFGAGRSAIPSPGPFCRKCLAPSFRVPSLKSNIAEEHSVEKEFGSVCSTDVLPRGQSVVSAALDISSKLRLMAGSGKLEQQISEARGRLAKVNGHRWRTPQAAGRIKRFLYLAQKPEPEDVDDVRAAYDEFCREKIKLAERILSTIERAQRSDPEFYQPHIERLVAALDCLRGTPDHNR
jgi:hypothetical protein